MKSRDEKRVSPFDDAFALWHMAGLDRDSSQQFRLTAHGDVEVGIELSGSERDESLRRGGNGCVAEFDEGYLQVDAAEDGELDISGDAFTICIRMRDKSGAWNAPIFGKYNGDENVDYFLGGIMGDEKPFDIIGHGGTRYPTPYFDMFGKANGPRSVVGSKAMIEFVWGSLPNNEIIEQLKEGGCGDPMLQEAIDGVMKVNFPVALINPEDWHDIIIRFTGPKLELFIDGVLVDEEFPVGITRSNHALCLFGAAMRNGEIQSGFRGQIDHVAIWKRCLTVVEICFLSGGSAATEQRELEILGENPEQMQYWHPGGHNLRAGDCMPFFHDGEFHLYYLAVRRNHHGKWQCGHGGLQVGHASTRDLVTWVHHPLAMEITQQWQCWWGTGDFVFHENQFYTFQKVPSLLSGQPYGGIQMAVSSDGIHYEERGPQPYLEGADCDLYLEKETQLYHLLTQGPRLKDGKHTLKRYYSENLETWQEAEGSFLVTDENFNPEICPHIFDWNGWYYLLAGFTTRAGVWRSRNLFGPWTLQSPVRLDQLAVPKSAGFFGGRRILAGFLHDRGWGGNLVFRELTQSEDGSLGTKFPSEMNPKTGNQLDLNFYAMSAGISGNGETVDIAQTTDAAIGMLDSVPANCRVSMRVIPEVAEGSFGLCFRGAGNYETGCEVRFEPLKNRMQFGVPKDGRLGLDTDDAFCDIDGLGKPFTLDIFCKEDIVDVCIDDRRTTITRYWDPDGDRLFFFGTESKVVFESIRVYPLIG